MNRPDLLLTRCWPATVEAELRMRYAVSVDPEDRKLSREALCAAMLRYDVLCPTSSDRLDAEILTTPGARVRLIANYGAGVDHIELGAARAVGIQVSNTPDVVTDDTADVAILLMLMASRRAGEGERELRAGRWSGLRPTHLLGQGLSGKTLGIVGFGRIGRAVAARGRRGFGMQVGYYSRSRAKPEIEAELHARWYGSLAELAGECDVLSLHCGGGADTFHLIDAALLKCMKRTAILVNTSRGSVVDEAELAWALRSEQIAAAGLDVFEREPLVHPALLALENVVLLPHLGSATIGTRIRMGLRVAVNIDRFFAHQEMPDRVA